MNRIYAVAAGLAVLLTPVAISPGAATADQNTLPAMPTTLGQPVDYVIQRALSQRGVPYVYGGGNASGPTNGVRPGVAPAVPGTATVPGTVLTPGTVPGAPLTPGTVPGSPLSPGALPGTVPGVAPAPTPVAAVGFDSSGLIQYAFAGAGIKMPRTSGEQCNVGQKVLPEQARPGDLLCYGPGGSQSVALFLGNGQMIEGTEPAVTVSPVRTSNMVPYLTRVIAS